MTKETQYATNFDGELLAPKLSLMKSIMSSLRMKLSNDIGIGKLYSAADVSEKYAVACMPNGWMVGIRLNVDFSESFRHQVRDLYNHVYSQPPFVMFSAGYLLMIA